MPLAKRIIPCLDVDEGRVVKGINFVDIRDAGDPVEQARTYDAAGADELVFLDITATHEDRDIMHDVVRRTADQVFIPLTVGGGLRSVDDMRAMLQAGADKVAINSAAVKDPDLIARGADAFGDQCIVVAIDAKRRDGDGPAWEVVVHGGRKPTGRDAVEWAAEAMERAADCAAHFGPDAAVRRGWAGLYAVTPDHSPIIEESLPGFINAVGFSGHGFMHAPATGQVVADIVTEGRPKTVEVSELGLDRFDDRDEDDRPEANVL